MNASVRTLLSAFAAVAAFEMLAIAGPLEEGIDAYRAKDYARAAEMWRPLADKGDAVAQFRLGTLYAEGNGVERNDATAFAWFQRAADQGYADAQYDVGASYFAGLGVRKDDAQAVRWFQRAANQGMVYAQLNLGLLYASGNGVARDNVEALKWLELALFALPAGGTRTDASRAIVDVAGKMTRDEIDEAKRRERDWKATPESK